MKQIKINYIISFLIFQFIFLLETKSQSDTTKKHDLNSVEVIGVRAESNTPVSEKTINKKDIQKNFFGQDPNYLISSTPSIMFYGDGGNYNGYTYIRLRGIDQTRINFTLNGMPLNEMEDMGVYFSNITDILNSANSIQIQRGVGTSTNGVASYAGSVSVETANVLDSGCTNIQFGAGSFNSNKMSVGFNTGLTKDNVGFYGRYSSNKSDGYRNNSGTDAQNFFISGGYFGEKNIFKITAISGYSKNDMAYLATSLADLKTDLKTNYLSQNEKDDFNQNIIQLQHTGRINKKSTISSSLYYNKIKGNYDIYFSPDMLNFQLFSEWIGFYSTYKLEGNKLKTSIGINGNNYYRTHQLSIKPDIASRLYSNKGEKNDVSLFWKANYSINKFNLFADLQYRYARFKYYPEMRYDIQTKQIDWNFFNPKAGITYNINKKIELYSSIAQIHREPTRNDMFGGFDDMDTTNMSLIGDLKLVKPEEVLDFEFGTKVNLGNNFKLQANVFEMRFKNEIAAVGQLSYLGLPLRKNVPESFRRGFEVDYDYLIDRCIRLYGNLTYMISEIKEYKTDFYTVVYKNTTPLLTPNVIFNQNLDLVFSKKFTIGFNYRYISESYLDNTNNKNLTLPSSSVFNSYAKINFEKNVSLLISVNNLFDVTYYNSGYAVGTDQHYFVGSKRNYFFTLNINF